MRVTFVNAAEKVRRPCLVSAWCLEPLVDVDSTDVDRLGAEPASLAAENKRPDLSQRSGDGWSRTHHE